MAKAASKIERAIDELQDYIDNCKPAPLSNSKIIVDRDQIESLIKDLRNKLPEEIEKYRKVISNQEAIEKDAKAKANELLQNVQNKSNELISESAITLQAQAEANDLMNTAAERAQAVYDEAVAQGDAYKASAQQYLSDMLMQIQGMIVDCLETTQKNTNKFLENLGATADTIQQNIDEMNQVEVTEEELLAEEVTSIFDEDNNTSGIDPNTGKLIVDLPMN